MGLRQKQSDRDRDVAERSPFVADRVREEFEAKTKELGLPGKAAIARHLSRVFAQLAEDLDDEFVRKVERR